jgi:protein-S-isoprenylcysteine O-methyltransferase Ste14
MATDREIIPVPDDKRPFRATKAFDLLTAAPLVGWYGFAVVGIAIRGSRALTSLASEPDWPFILNICSQLATGVFLGVQLVLFLVRRVPIAKASGILPRAAGFVGAGLVFAFLAMPRVALSPSMAAISIGGTLFATLASIVSVASLGRAFSITPQARQLVTNGVFRVVRHPLYLAEQIGNFALMLQFKQPWAVLLALASLAAQFPRMLYEEQILRATFPDYAAYASRTWRLIPGLY